MILGIDIPAKFGVSETMAQWDDKQADAEADVRCKNWGYAGASTFRNELPVQVVCHQIPGGISPCGAKTYRILYQCVDKNQQN